MRISVNQKLCTGCKSCMSVCSFYHDKVNTPNKSRIVVQHNGDWYIPKVEYCRQCVKPKCVEVCPTGAISKDNDTGLVYIKEELCCGCGLCVEACPFNAIFIDNDEFIAFKCDSCNGDPQCIKRCSAKAITLV